MNTICSFPPIARRDATRLILGTMPGIASLAAQQYYAHPRNAFWPIMEIALGVPLRLSYEERCLQLMERGLAVWDVLESCVRGGSLDSAIEPQSIVPYDFNAFFAHHTAIELICFNGTKAAELWRRHVVPTLPEATRKIRTVRLPSTSPAHAGMPLAEKAARWRETLLLPRLSVPGT